MAKLAKPTMSKYSLGNFEDAKTGGSCSPLKGRFVRVCLKRSGKVGPEVSGTCRIK